MNKRTHVVLPDDLVKDIDALVGPRHRSNFIREAAEEKLMRLKQIASIRAAVGAWRDTDHPELERGAAKWVAKTRQQDEHRFKKVTARKCPVSSNNNR